MKRLLEILKHRRFIAALALLVLAVTLWFVGPLIGVGEARPLETVLARALVIGAIIAIWVVVELLRELRAHRAAKQLGLGIAAQESDTESRSSEEAALLSERFQEAIDVLRNSGPGGGRRSLYELPWYIIIGPPGSGKTTALANSGLKFPLSDRFGTEALRGVGGTRNCDWWFTDEAILLDTAGRYTTQDSQASVDRAAWESFLDLLKKHRRRRPINGVMVAISAADLMTLSDTERSAHARAIRQRIHELDSHFGIRFPVYVLLTKIDLVAGFMEFFEDLSNEERAQVWGTTLALPEGNNKSVDLQALPAELEALVARLEARVLTRLHDERDAGRRTAIYGFPQQVASLNATVKEFLEAVFSGSRFEQAPLLRGVYFTSGTQEGAPIDRLISAMSSSFGFEWRGSSPFAGRGRSYFLTRLLRNVIFQESGLAGTNRRLERHLAWLQRGAYAAIAVLCVALLGAWLLSFQRNTLLLEQAAQQAEASRELLATAPTDTRSLSALLPILDALRALPGGYGERDVEPPLRAGFGLYQGAKLGRQAEGAYRRALVGLLLPRILWRLEEAIDRAGADLEFTYEALKVYLMLGSEEHYDAEAIKAWVAIDWEARLYSELGDDGYRRLTEHLDALLETRPAPLPTPINIQLVQLARQKLERVSLDERIYARLKSSRSFSDLPGFNVSDAAGVDAALVFTRSSGQPLSSGIPALFTREGYDRVFSSVDSAETIRDLMSESWVLKDSMSAADLAELPKIVEGLRSLYFEEYSKAYDELISDVRLLPFSTPAEAARLLTIISRRTASPLMQLLEAVQRQTTFSVPAAPKEGEDQNVSSALEPGREYLKGVISGQAAQVTSVAGRATEYANQVEKDFASLNDQIAGGAVEHLLELLRQLAGAMNTLANQQSGSALPDAAARQAQGTIQAIQLEAQGQSVPLLANVLQSASGGAENLLRGGVERHTDLEWQAGPLEFCNRAIEGRYPFAAAGDSQVRLEDFARFFGFGGELDRFFEGYAKDLIETSKRPWRARATAASLVRLRPEAIKMFEIGQTIKEAFFRGDLNPHVSFELTPTDMDASITKFSATIDGQPFDYAHGPPRPKILQWPGPDGLGEVRLEMAPEAGQSMRLERGSWAWFRILDDAQLSSLGRERYSITFRIGSRAAHYELVARSAFNPFDMVALRQFRCVQDLSL